MSHRIIIADVLDGLRQLDDESVQCIVTSPPYWNLRNYGVDGQIGLEPTISEYVEKMRDVFRECKRVLRNDGTLWLNIGDSYNGQGARSPSILPNGDLSYRAGGNAFNVKGLKKKELCGIPWRLAFALQDDGWYLRKDIIWAKPNPMPESVRDRPTSAHEYIFLLTKSPKYFYDADAIREPLAESSIARLSQDVANQAGSDRANGGAKTNGTMKAVKYEGDSLIRPSGPSRAERKMPPIGGLKHPGENGNPTYSGNTPEWTQGANARSVWTIATEPYSGSHYAVFPSELPRRCILAGSKAGDTVLDPFAGSGTTIQVAIELGRNVIGIDLDERNRKLIEQRILGSQPPLLI